MDRERPIRIIGGGPAGSAAAIAAFQFGGEVHLYEQSRTPHHKVCGEFISAEACQVLDELGIWSKFLELKPALTRRCCLRFGSRAKEWKLAEPAFGLSRLELDRLLLSHAATIGARVFRGERAQKDQQEPGAIVIDASGRHGEASRPGRLFGFKAHFEGPPNDAVEVFFGPYGYIGISAVENGTTNVCGLASEESLRKYDFRFDDFLFAFTDLSSRLKQLSRCIPWLATGPLIYSGIRRRVDTPIYAAGDAMGFVDPFTGSGILNGLLTGRMAGIAAAQGIAPEIYVEKCHILMRRPLVISALFRTFLDWGCAGYLASFFPSNWMYRLTRASVSE